MRESYLTNSAKETERLAEKLAKDLAKTGETIALYGELGSGKTTFVKGLAKGFGIKKRIVSPTFIFIRRYEILQPKTQVKNTPGESLRATPGVEESKSARFKKTPPRWQAGAQAEAITPRMVEELPRTRFLYHIDLYRIERDEDSRGLGLEEVLSNPKDIIAIEWAEKIKKILPEKRINIHFRYLGENKREIVIDRWNTMGVRLKKAIEILKKGGIVVFPTDTAFGVGCLIDKKQAVKKLFKIRKRPKTQAVPVLVSSIEMALKYLKPLSKEVKRLMEKYWPGGLTIVYPCKTEKVLKLVRGGGKTLGIRIPDHQIPLKLISSLGRPIVGTSANFHGGETPYKFEDLDKEFVKKVDLVIPGECPKGKVSTVIDCSKKPWRILRKGAVKIKLKIKNKI